jgi:hypothetical protein
VAVEREQLRQRKLVSVASPSYPVAGQSDNPCQLVNLQFSIFNLKFVARLSGGS